MAKYISNLHDRKHVRLSALELERHREMLNMLSEWIDTVYYNENRKTIFIDRMMARKYKVMRKMLRENCFYDADLWNYVKSLPNIWILKKWLLEILLVACFFLIRFSISFFYEICTGFPFPRRLNTDVDPRFIILHIFGLLYVYLFYRRFVAYESLRCNLLEISGIIRKDINNNSNR